MKLNYDRKSKDPTYFVQKGYRIGKKTSTKNIYRIGKHSELLAITDNPLAYAKEIVAKFNKEEAENHQLPLEWKIDFEEKVRAFGGVVSSSTLKNVGYFYLQHIYHDLNMASFFKNAAADRKIEFDPSLVNQFLTFSRILFPGSKLDSHRHLNQFYGDPQFDYVHILRTMDLLSENYEEYLSHLFRQSSNIVKRNTSVCYYDCTNFYFEIESPDPDYTDPVTGEIIPAFRVYGPSKEHRPNPLIEMGLMMDADGIPLTMCLAPGSRNEQVTAIPLEKELLRMLDENNKEFIYCADAGLGSYNIRKFNAMGGRAFVVTQSIKKLSDVLQKAVFNDYDYRMLSTGRPVTVKELKEFDSSNEGNLPLYTDKAYKIIPADSLQDLGLYEFIELSDGNVRKRKAKGLLKQSLIVTFSRKMMEYQRWIRGRQIERAKTMLKNLDPETYKKGPNDVTRFIKRCTTGKNGEKVSDLYFLDEEKIREEEKYDGYYAVATNLDDDVATVLGIIESRYKIEDCFRILKSNFDGRPVYHHIPRRIKAHFMICYTALLIFRLLEKQLDNLDSHFTVSNIIETLQNLQVANVDDIAYMATYNGSQVLSALALLYPDIDLSRKYYLPKDLNKTFKKLSK